MVSLNLDFIGFGADKVGETITHIGGAGFGEGEAENVFWASVGLFKDIGDADGKELGLASAWASDDEERAVDVVDGGTLVGVERGVGTVKGRGL